MSYDVKMERTREDMPDMCVVCAEKHDEFYVELPYRTWIGGRTDRDINTMGGNYECSRGHRWTCWWGRHLPGTVPIAKRVSPGKKKSKTTAKLQVAVKEAKATKRRRSISQAVKIAVAIRDGGRCVQCGSAENLEYDHIHPWSKGGSSEFDNIQLLCSSCNRTKRDKTQ